MSHEENHSGLEGHCFKVKDLIVNMSKISCKSSNVNGIFYVMWMLWIKYIQTEKMQIAGCKNTYHKTSSKQVPFSSSISTKQKERKDLNYKIIRKFQINSILYG